MNCSYADRRQTATQVVGDRAYRSGLLGFLLLRFADDGDEAAFVRAQTAISAALFRGLTYTCGAATIIHAGISVADGAPDPLPLLGLPLVIAAAWHSEAFVQSLRVRLLCLMLVAFYFNMRFAVGVFFGDKSHASPTVASGQPLPYSLLGLWHKGCDSAAAILCALLSVIAAHGDCAVCRTLSGNWQAPPCSCCVPKPSGCGCTTPSLSWC